MNVAIFRDLFVNAFLIHSDLALRPHVVWLDNFSHSYAAQLQGIASGAYKSCLWTGEAWHEWRARPNCAPVDLTFVKDADGNVIPAMQPMAIAQPTFERVQGWMKQLDAKDPDMFSRSVVKRYHVTRVPLKPSIKDARRLGRHDLAQILKEHRDGIGYMHPRRIIDLNIGSNRGLLQILKMFSDERKCPEATQYSVVCVDCNIFVRTLKVCWLLLFLHHVGGAERMFKFLLGCDHLASTPTTTGFSNHMFRNYQNPFCSFLCCSHNFTKTHLLS